MIKFELFCWGDVVFPIMGTEHPETRCIVQYMLPLSPVVFSCTTTMTGSSLAIWTVRAGGTASIQKCVLGSDVRS